MSTVLGWQRERPLVHVHTSPSLVKSYPHIISCSDQPRLTTMSTTQPTPATSSTSNFIAIFEVASKKYKKLTKQDLNAHPFSVEFGKCDSPDAVLNVFRKQAEIFDEIRKGDERLIKWLDPMVNILFSFSAALAEGVGLVSFHGVDPSHLQQTSS